MYLFLRQKVTESPHTSINVYQLHQNKCIVTNISSSSSSPSSKCITAAYKSSIPWHSYLQVSQSKSVSAIKHLEKRYLSSVFTWHRISPISRTVMESCVMTQRDSSEYLHNTHTTVHLPHTLKHVVNSDVQMVASGTPLAVKSELEADMHSLTPTSQTIPISCDINTTGTIHATMTMTTTITINSCHLVSKCLLHMTVAHAYRITFKQRNCTVKIKQDKITYNKKGINNEVC